MCCCQKILDLCSTGTCQDSEIELGILAKVAGAYKLVTDFKGVEFTIEKEVEIDDELSFPTGDLNENYTFQCQLYDPNGVKVLIEKDGVQYDCFQFKTKLSYAI